MRKFTGWIVLYTALSLTAGPARASSPSQDYKALIHQFLLEWTASDPHTIFDEAARQKPQWTKSEPIQSEPLPKLLQLGHFGLEGDAGSFMASALRDLVIENATDEAYQLKAAAVATALRFVATNGAGMDNGGILILNQLLDSKFASVRAASAEAITSGGLIEGHSNRQLYLRKYFSESDPSVKLALQKVVQLYDPDSITYGPTGPGRIFRQLRSACEGWLTGLKNKN